MSEILLPVGRMIGGSLYKPQPKLDNFGKPKHAADGTPMTAFNFGVAIPKGAEQHWSQSVWGAEIYKVGFAAYQAQCQNPAFAWKIIDGDSQVPNKKNRKPCDQEGYKGNWILWFGQSWCPKLVNKDGSIELTEPDSIVPGYFVQVFVSVKGNAPSPTPGVYLNPVAVALAGYGERIESVSVDTSSVGFGTGAAPAGMSAVPVAAAVFTPPNVSVGAPFGQVQQMAPNQPNPTFAQAVPNPAFLAVPPIPVMAPPPPKPAHVMTAAAGGATYEQMIGAGWNDSLLLAHGMMSA